MSWNRPRNGEAVSRPLQNRKGFSFSARGAVAGLIVVVGAAGAWWLLSESETRQETASTKQGLIKDAKPVVAMTNEAPKEKIRPYDDYDHEKCYRDANGILRDKRGGCRVIDPAATYLEPQEFGSSIAKIFTRQPDRCISRLLTFRPGNMGIPDRVDYHSESFQKDFKESLKEPIVIGEEDPAQVKKIKQAMIDARIEICDRMRSGEDLGDILTETRRELLRLGEFRKNVMSELRTQLGKDELSNADAETFIEAANKMLEEHGIRPVNKTTMLKWNLRLKEKE